MQPLFALFNYIYPLAPEIEAYLKSILQCQEIKAGEYILKKGRVNRNIYFIESGLVRIFYELPKREVTTWFLKENDIFISVRSFFRQQPSELNIIALEDCVLWFITHEQLEEVCRLYPAFNNHRIWLTEEYYCRSEARQEDMLALDAYERYERFATKYPDLLQRIPLGLIPSYLDTAESTFKDIRKKYAKK